MLFHILTEHGSTWGRWGNKKLRKVSVPG